MLYHYSTTQSTVALSSGEAELSGICKAAPKAMCLRSVAADIGVELQVEVLTDATAAIGICRRRGLGKIRNLAVADLWIQDKVRSNEITLTKVYGPDNPADMFTKYIPQADMHNNVQKLGLFYEAGRQTPRHSSRIASSPMTAFLWVPSNAIDGTHGFDLLSFNENL